jgi:hypothetical protein
MAEVAVRGAGCEDEVVVEHRGSALEIDPAGGCVDVDDLVHHNLGISILTKDRANRLGDITWREHGECHLVEQGLEGVVILAIDQRDVDREFAQALRSVDTGKAATNDDDPRVFAVGIDGGHAGLSLQCGLKVKMRI